MTSRKNTAKPLPTQERLRELLDYNADTGVFRWKTEKRHSCHKVGAVAGSYTAIGYRQIKIDGINYLAHRLAFVWMNSQCPDIVDHIDRNVENNSWANLRPANLSQNNGNSILNAKNSSGYKGVHFDKRTEKWRAQIRKNGSRRWLGEFDTAEDAANAYRIAAKEQWGEFAHCP